MAKVRPLPSPGKARPLQIVNLRDFRGGLASRNGDSLDVRTNELRYCQNIIIQNTGGISSRGGFVKTTTITNGVANFDNQTAWIGETPDGKLAVAYYSSATSASYYAALTSSGSYSQTTYAGSTRYRGVGANARVAFMRGSTTASSISTFIVGDSGGDAVYKDGTAMSKTNPTFQDSFASPSGSYFPVCQWICTHLNYMFAGATYVAAGTVESATRVRWSHPGDPGSWRTNDWIDMPDGTTILGMCSIGDQLVVFTDGAVFAIRGYSAETFSLQKIAERGLDTLSSWNNYCRTNDGKCFWLNADGVYLYDGQQVSRISDPVNELFDSTARKNIMAPMVFVHAPRPMLVIPMQKANGASASPSSSQYMWVWHADTNSWVRWNVPANWTSTGRAFYTEWGGDTNSSSRLFCADGTALLRYDPTAAADNVTGSSAANINANFTTAWVDADQPAIKKSWKRPELVYRGTVAGDFTITSYNDYKASTAVKTITSSNAGNATDYEVDKLTALGPARAVSIKVQAPTATNTYWALEDIALKYRPKSLRN